MKSGPASAMPPVPDRLITMKYCSKHIARLTLMIVLAVLFFAGTVMAQTPIGTVIENQGQLRFNTLDGGSQQSVLSNITNTVVTGPLTLGLQKSASSATALPGDTVSYKILIVNTGADLLSGVGVTDTLPSSLIVLDATRGILNGNVLTWNIGDMPAGARDSVLIRAIVRDRIFAGTVISNSSYGHDTTGWRVISIGNFVVGALPGFDLNKSVDKSMVDAGDTLSYRIDFSNTGNVTLTNLVVSDTLPSSVQFLSGSPGVTFNNGVITHNRDSLTINNGDSIRVDVVVQSGLEGGYPD